MRQRQGERRQQALGYQRDDDADSEEEAVGRRHPEPQRGTAKNATPVAIASAATPRTARSSSGGAGGLRWTSRGERRRARRVACARSRPRPRRPPPAAATCLPAAGPPPRAGRATHSPVSIDTSTIRSRPRCTPRRPRCGRPRRRAGRRPGTRSTAAPPSPPVADDASGHGQQRRSAPWPARRGTSCGKRTPR